MSAFERIEIKVMPDGKIEVNCLNWAEGDSQIEVENLVNRLKEKGFQVSQGKSSIEYTGEVHSVYHHLCGEHHHHGHEHDGVYHYH